ncbi:hypothetical protein B0H14DRAFT_2618994 [Mycena olivaceomarginata]|nr:hypothetical protein B0H14DRAFT_2618994 [Mycena olivaceomarginata]
MLGLWWTTFPWYEGYGPDGTPVPKEKGVSAPPRAGEMLGVGGIAPAPTASTDASAPTTSADASSTDAPTATTTTAMPSTDVSLTPASVIASAGQWAATGGVNPEFRDKIKGEVAAQVKGWFSHKKTATNRSNKNPFLDWLEGFERPGPAPRKLPLHKFYMQHPDYADAVEGRFNEKWPDAKLEQNARRSCLWRRTRGTRRELAKELDEEHEEALARYTGRADKVSEPDEPDAAKREACRMNLAQVVQPFLDGINKLTGLHVTLLAGFAPPSGSDRFTMTSLHSGRTLDIGGSPGYKFHEWDPEGFKKNVMVHWMKFLAETAEHTATRVAPGSGGARLEVPAPTGMAMEVPVPPGSGNVASAAPEQSLTNNKESDGGRSRKRRDITPNETPSPTVSRNSSREGSRSPSPERAPTLPSPPVQRSATPELPTGYELGRAMQELLELLPTDERRHRLYRLSRLHIEEFNRENNLVRNAALLDAAEAASGNSSGVGATETDATPPPACPGQQNAVGKTRGEQRAGKEGGWGGVPRRVRGRRRREMAQKGKKKAEYAEAEGEGVEEGTARANKESWPKWMRDGCTLPRGVSCGWFGRLACDGENLDAAGGSLWIPDLDPQKSHNGSSTGGSTTRETQVENHEKLVRKWWEWWTSLAPEWRKKDENGRPAIGDEIGNWGVLGASWREWDVDSPAAAGVVEARGSEGGGKRRVGRRRSGRRLGAQGLAVRGEQQVQHPPIHTI